MSAPDNAPPGCPRRHDESSGPRRCGEDTTCPLHLRLFLLRPGKGRPPTSWRLDAQRELDDSCTLDVCERANASGVELTEREIAVFLGISERAVQQIVKRATPKYRRALLRVIISDPTR